MTANVAPRAMAELCPKPWQATPSERADSSAPARPAQAAVLRAQPGARQWAMRQLGLCGDAVRLLITPLTAAGQAAVAQALSEAGLR